MDKMESIKMKKIMHKKIHGTETKLSLASIVLIILLALVFLMYEGQVFKSGVIHSKNHSIASLSIGNLTCDQNAQLCQIGMKG
jgi:hypothetical protein